MIVDGITIKILWYDFFLMDYLLEFKLGMKPIFRNLCFKKLAKLFCDYDLVSVHMLRCGEIAKNVKLRFGIPFTVTWHGSDIHSNPWLTKNIYDRTKTVLESADMNYFVSQALLNKSEEISTNTKRMVLYNGVDKVVFYQYSKRRRALAQAKLGVPSSCYNIAFIGHLVPIKNVLCLPEVFECIKKQIPDACFHIAGDGLLLKPLRSLCDLHQIPVHFYGRLDKNEMADFYNAIDLMVLPSLNEGLPLVVVEAKACGTEVVASRVGGIAEVIGMDNTVALGDGFIQELAGKCIDKYESSHFFSLSEKFDWKNTALIENRVYQMILSDSNKMNDHG